MAPKTPMIMQHEIARTHEKKKVGECCVRALQNIRNMRCVSQGRARNNNGALIDMRYESRGHETSILMEMVKELINQRRK